MTDARKFKVGDVVYAEGRSALLGDVVSIEEDNGINWVEINWRPATWTEDEDDLMLADDQTPPKEPT